MTPLMWRRFGFRGHVVVVIQQWTDPFGRPMLRIEAEGDAVLAESLGETEFLAEAAAEAAT